MTSLQQIANPNKLSMLRPCEVSKIYRENEIEHEKSPPDLMFSYRNFKQIFPTFISAISAIFSAPKQFLS